MTTTKRVRYTLKFKQEALRLIEAGASQTSVAELVGVVPQTLEKWIYESREGKLQTGDFKPMTPEQMEIALLRAELSRIKMQCAILGRTVFFSEMSSLSFPAVDSHALIC